MKSSKEKNSNTKSYNNASDDPVFRTRESQNSKEDKYDPSKYSVHYNTLNDPAEDLATTKSKEQVPKDLQLKKSSLERISERQTKSSQSHIKLKKAKEQDQDQDAFSEGLGNRTIRETSELQMTVDFKDNKGLLSVFY